MNTFHKGMSALVVFGILMTAIWLWATMTDLDSSRASALRANFQTPAAMPAPAPQHELMLRVHRAPADTIAHNAQPVAIPAPAHSK